jgi:hypothetical protein
MVSKSDTNGIISNLALQHNLKRVDISAIPSGVKFELSASFLNPTPLSLSIGHASTRISLGGAMFMDVLLSGVNIVKSDGMQDIEFTAIATFGSGNELELAVSRLVKDVVVDRRGFSTNSPLTVGFEFGVSSEDKIGIFNKIRLPVPIPEGNYSLI